MRIPRSAQAKILVPMVCMQCVRDIQLQEISLKGTEPLTFPSGRIYLYVYYGMDT